MQFGMQKLKNIKEEHQKQNYEENLESKMVQNAESRKNQTQNR